MLEQPLTPPELNNGPDIIEVGDTVRVYQSVGNKHYKCIEGEIEPTYLYTAKINSAYYIVGKVIDYNEQTEVCRVEYYHQDNPYLIDTAYHNMEREY